jgi:hypothetical protein
MRNGRLREVKQRHQLTYADLSCVLAQNIDELHPHWIAEGLGDVRDPIGFVPLDIGVDDRLATTLAWRALDFRRESRSTTIYVET